MTSALPSVDVVVFDWDGTLVSSADASFRCYATVFGGYGIPFDREAYAATYSPNWYRTYTALGLPEDRWEEADALWAESYCREEVPLVEGARAALDRLSAAGITQALVTSGDRARVERELAAHGVAGRFAAVVYGQDATLKKPHPEALHLALDRLGVPAVRAVYVGDSPEDVEMARNAGMWSIGIPGGFPNRDALERSQPDVFAPCLADAVDAIIAARRPGSAR
jgi:HAD superfamily hydrolase (TIGR01509 family)